MSIADHPYILEIETMWREGYRASYINSQLELLGGDLVNKKSLSKYGNRNWSTPVYKLEFEADAGPLVDNLTEVNELLAQLQQAGLNVKDISIENKKYPGWSRDKEGSEAVSVAQETKVHKVRIVPGASDIPLVQSADLNIKVSFPKPKQEEKSKDIGLAISYPDMQISYWRSPYGDLVESQDESAIDVAHQITAYLDGKYGVDDLVNAGDNLDFPEFSMKFVSGPGFWQTTQLSIDRASREAAIQAEIAPNATRVWLEGNHEARQSKYVAEKAPQLLGLTQTEGTLPVLSVPHLCNFEKYNMNYMSGYPDASYWPTENLRFIHGEYVSATPGGTSAKYLSQPVTTIAGHLHHIEVLQKTTDIRGLIETHTSATCGCLCRIDGAVNSTKTGIDIEGKQAIQRAENWQNGFGVIWYSKTASFDPVVEVINIRDGVAIYGGQRFVANEDNVRQIRGF